MLSGLIHQMAQPIIVASMRSQMHSVGHRRSVTSGKHGIVIVAIGGQRRGRIPAKARQTHGTSCLILVFEEEHGKPGSLWLCVPMRMDLEEVQNFEEVFLRIGGIPRSNQCPSMYDQGLVALRPSLRAALNDYLIAVIEKM